MKTYLPAEFKVMIEDERCIRCQTCVKQCSFDALSFNDHADKVRVRDEHCVACHRCEVLCPTNAITVVKNPLTIRENDYWGHDAVKTVWKQAETGGMILTSCGNDRATPTYFERIVLDACQVTNPSIDPLREPMELATFIGRKPDRVDIEVISEPDPGNGYAAASVALKTTMPPQIRIETPIMFAPMSLGAISYNTQRSVAQAASEFGTLWNTGEGGLHKDFYEFGGNAIVQVASGRFGVHQEYLDAAAIVEIKIGQGAKPGIGGHLPGEKVSDLISETRMIPEGTDAISPAPHHDIYSIEDLSLLVNALKEATRYTKPVSVKIAAVHNAAAIASGIARAGADMIVIDGIRGGTGATPAVVRDHTGIPIELAIAAVDDRLRQEGIRNWVSLVATGGIRSSSDVIKAIALGADAVYIATAALVALGCHICQKCYTGNCAWGIAKARPRQAGQPRCRHAPPAEPAARVEPRHQGGPRLDGRQLHREPAGQPHPPAGPRDDRRRAADPRDPARGSVEAMETTTLDIAMDGTTATIDARGVPYRDLNERVRELADGGVERIVLENVNGQRYIGTGLPRPIDIEVHGTAGEDLAAFMDGSRVVVHGNAQNAVANTLNEGLVVIHGHAGDVCGYGMRGGKVFIKSNVGYRVGIHMKAYQDKVPVMVIGGEAHDFLGEYMAGGILIVLALGTEHVDFTAHHIGTGMHGGTIYLRGGIDPFQLGKEVAVVEQTDEDRAELAQYVTQFAGHFDMDAEEILDAEFNKLVPVSLRPYGRLYAY